MVFTGLSLSPALATVLFIVAVVAGIRYRNVWKNEGPRWQLWVLGAVAAVCLLTVAFVPVAV